MLKIRRLFTAAALATAAALSPALAEGFSDSQKQELEAIIKSYLLANPELLQEMAERLEAKSKQAEESLRTKALLTYKDEVFKTTTDPIIGNPKGDVTIVEFMDYNCGWCKKAMVEVGALLEADKNVRVVFKEFPIFGEGSEYAARAAIAAGQQGKYWELHRALFSHEGQVTKVVVDQLAEQQGLDLAKLKLAIESKEVGEQVAANLSLGQNLAINGTPAFIIDDKVFGGYLPLDGLKATVAQVRSDGCKMC
jgi:protein-disulfide isomerase